MGAVVAIELGSDGATEFANELTLVVRFRRLSRPSTAKALCPDSEVRCHRLPAAIDNPR